MGWGTGSGSGLGTGSGTGTGTGTATGTGTGNRHGTGSGSETKSETETGSESETGSETKTGSETESETGSETESGAAKTYALAEAAMRAGETARAERLLVQILDEHTGTRLAAAAQLDLARLAFERRDYTRAHTLVDRLLAARVDANLERPAQRLRCKILVAQGKDCPAS
jgi:predicted negative regulator of RcsB-dependent stress response